ncbi:response regulator transcription factor [Kiloniella sp.]|uniref:response regulator transcription factor n=1 Tax=Kiloniella sp. TaxID=1938587 RepID=UPI003B0224A2
MKRGDSIIRILLADDHPLVRDGLRSCLEMYENIEVIGEAKTGSEALDKAAELKPDVQRQ